MTDSERDARIAGLEARIAELEEALRRPRMTSMRATRRCPACNGRHLLHFRRIKDVAHNGMVDLSLQKVYSIWSGVKLNAGLLEAFACRTCKLVEWHAEVSDVEPDGESVLEIEGDADDVPASPPYR